MSRAITSFRIRRLINLLTFLRKHKEHGVETEEIMRQCEYTDRRALQDDIKMLREEYRADIVFKRTKPYRYCLKSEGDFFLSLNLNEQDIIALVAGLTMTEHFLPHMKGNCNFLWDKIQKILPETFIKFGQWLAEAVTIASPISKMNADVFELILKSLREKTIIEIEYVSPYKTRKTRSHILAPWGVFFRSHAWYLLAGSLKKEEELQKTFVFRLSRIRNIKLHPEIAFVNHPDDYSQEKFTSSAWFVSLGKLEYDICLKIIEPMATIVSETIWNPTQEIIKLDNNTIKLTAKVPDLKEVARWILSSAPYVIVESPDELRIIVHDLAEQMTKLNPITPSNATTDHF